MRAFLFRKLEIDGINYYQLYEEREDFQNSSDFSSFADFDNRTSKDNFYIDADGDIKVEDAISLNIYTDSSSGLKPINDSKDFSKIFDAFKERFGIDTRKNKSIIEIVNEVNKKVLFQRTTVTNLVKQIYLNQTIMNSNLPVELKLKQKNNILFHGPIGSGKKSIIEILEKNIGIPYADITITGELKNDLANIIEQLLSHTKNDNQASKGIVFIRDNFVGLMEIFDDKIFSVPSFFTSQEVITYGKHKIDFRTLTFVVLFDDRMDLLDDTDIKDIQNMADCECNISTAKLFDISKYQILLSENGRLRHYERFLNQYGKKIVVDEKSLRRIIRACSSIDPGMNLLNSVIDSVMKTSLLDGVDDVYIDKKCADLFVPVIVSHSIIKEQRQDIPHSNQKKVLNDELKDIYDIVTNNVVGQDKQVKTILYTILQNRRMANKEGLDDPKKYIKNILIRGESGSGKTLIVETISKVLGIPFFIADATQYTEEGYVGSSVTDMLISLYHAADEDLEKAQRGILVIDEIDKKVNGSNSNDISRGAVLDGLLKIVEGAVIPINVGNRIQEQIVMFDTSRLTVICSGAFEGIEAYRDERLGKRKLGFENNYDKNSVDMRIKDEDYDKYGMKKQFMARLPVMIELNPITPDLLVHIMKHSSSSALLTEKTILNVQGIEVEYTESFYEALAKEAYNMKVGARGISKALERVLSSINIENIEASEVAKIVFDGDVVSDPNKIVLVPRVKSKEKIK